MILPQIVVLVLAILDKVSCSVISNDSQKEDNHTNTLKLVHVLFRHGDRTNDALSTYPNDPHINETYFPYGIGQLTNAGKKKEYLIGRALSKRYYNFLGDTYTPDVLEARSTNMDRTKMSLELALAGLYPPQHTELEWDADLNWQPIPYNYVPLDKDKLLIISLLFCKNYIKLLKEYLSSPSGTEIQQKYADLYGYLSEHSGMTVKSMGDVMRIYFALAAEQEWGLELPPWTTKVFPKYMEEATIDHYIVSSGTTELKQLSGGFLVKEMIKNMQAKVRNTLNPQSRKIFLYSAHETNVAYVMNALEVYFPHVPPYGAYLLVELHEINSVYGVKIFYQDYSSAEPKPLEIPGCDQFCPLEHFVKILQKNLPTDEGACESS